MERVSPLLAAAESGDVHELTNALDAGEDLEQRNDRGASALIISAQMGHEAFTEELLNKAMFFGITSQKLAIAKNCVNDTALHWAAYNGNERAVVSLLQHGAEMEAIGEYGNRPLHLACSRNHDRVASILLQRGASVQGRNDYGNLPVDLATSAAIRKTVNAVMIGGQGERDRLAREFAEADAARAAAEAAAREAEEEKIRKKREAEETAQRKREMEEAEERRLEAEERDRARREEEERIAAEEAAKKAAEDEANRLAAEALNAKPKKGKGKGKKK